MHGVLEAVNSAMQALFQSKELPAEPLKFLGEALLAAASSPNGPTHGVQASATAADTGARHH